MSSSDMSVSATTKIPVSEITTFRAPESTPTRTSSDNDPEEKSRVLIIQASKGWIAR